jgi:hypothetical protein
MTARRAAGPYPLGRMSPFWLWMQVVIVVFTVAGMIIAITKLT